MGPEVFVGANIQWTSWTAWGSKDENVNEEEEEEERHRLGLVSLLIF